MNFIPNSSFRSLSADNYTSPRKILNFKSASIKLGLIKSFKFTYKSPSKFEENKLQPGVPIAFSKGPIKITYRRLPRFNPTIYADDPEKTSKII